jgi:hypothetical protein
LLKKWRMLKATDEWVVSILKASGAAWTAAARAKREARVSSRFMRFTEVEDADG